MSKHNQQHHPRHLDGNDPTLGELRQYWGYLANSVVFIQISADISSALKIFETINERGIGLNPMDLLKNFGLPRKSGREEFTRLKELSPTIYKAMNPLPLRGKRPCKTADEKRQREETEKATS